MVNEVILIGNVGADVETAILPSGTAAAKFRMATNEKWTNPDGTTGEHTEWHTVKATGKLADRVARNIVKGGRVYVKGTIKTETWDDKTTGEKRERKVIMAFNVLMLDGNSAK